MIEDCHGGGDTGEALPGVKAEAGDVPDPA
jgi:hypothetical protein